MKKTIITILTAVISNGQLLAEDDLKPHDPPIQNKFMPTARGGQFKDLILPTPIINRLTSKGIWGHPNVLPRDIENGMESNDFHFWGGNPVKNDDGRYHIITDRWPAENKFSPGWHGSEGVHYVSDNPLGPYKTSGVVVGRMHNAETIRLPDGKYAVAGMNNRIFLADKMEGPWEGAGKMELDTNGFRPPTNLGANVTYTLRPDNSIVAFRKNGDFTVSNTGIKGPFKIIATDTYESNDGYAEDPVIWRSRHQYHVIYNKAQLERSLYMRSLNGIDWKNEYGYPYIAGAPLAYTDGTVNKWHELERPKVIRDDLGRASHLCMGVTDYHRNQSNLPKYGSKSLIIPLQTEKLIHILSDGPITEKTKQIRLRIESEKGFDARNDLKIESLRFGSDSVVNFGGGCVPVGSKVDGSDLIVTFEGEHGMTHHDYDFKLLGRGENDSLVFGYALLPGKSPAAATLICLPLRFDNKVFLSSKVENFGHSDSKPQHVYLCRNVKGADKRVLLKKINISALKPYESFDIREEVPEFDKNKVEYQLIVAGSPQEYWRRVDVSDASLKYDGAWKTVYGTEGVFMNSEITTKEPGDRITFTFDGTRAIVYGRVSRRGTYTMNATLDGENLGPIRASFHDCNSVKILQTPLLKDGKHTLVLENTGKSPVYINSFAYESVDNLHR
jgi:hypothetical protein